MQASTINKMVADMKPPTPVKAPLSRRAAEVRRYAKFYSKLDFGHFYVTGILDTDSPFPTWLPDEDYEWLRRFYEFELGADDDAMLSILQLRTGDMEMPRAVIEAMLLDQHAGLGEVAEATGWDEEVLEGYEKLFFNVRDRFTDHLFIAKVAYPGSRVQETYANYMEEEDIACLLKRAGHNNGIADVAYMAGLKSSLVYQLSNSEAPIKLEQTIMANGFILARNGWLHDGNSESVRSARMLLAAAKQNGDGDSETDPFLSASDALAGELTKVKKTEAKQALTYQRKIQEDATQMVTH